MNKYFKKLNSMFAKNEGEFLKLIPNCPQFTSEQIRIIYKALYKASDLHRGQLRKNGEPYINHPIAVASILANLGLDYETICAALLHDTVEDTEYSLEKCEKDFGYQITRIVDGVTKIGNDINEETHEKILKASQIEPRIIAVKVAGDRLHNMATLDALKPQKQIAIATETKDFYIPITKILGIYQLKDELQDLCLYFLDRESFIQIYNEREEIKSKYKSILNDLGEDVQYLLSKEGIAMSYIPRVKNVGGIYKAAKEGEELSDFLAVKMVVNDRSMCYNALGYVHEVAKPLKYGFNDFIAIPKKNGYKSLSTNVSYKDLDIQVRIRTKDMQRANDMGIFSDLNSVSESLSSDMRKSLDKLIKK